MRLRLLPGRGVPGAAGLCPEGCCAPPALSRCRPWQPEVTDEGLQAVAALTQLQSLHLGGACGLGERTCAALARRLPGLTSLQLTDCPSLSDGALFRLAPLVPGLLRLGLCGCTGVTDIALAGVLRGATRRAQLGRAWLALGCLRCGSGGSGVQLSPACAHTACPACNSRPLQAGPPGDGGLPPQHHGCGPARAGRPAPPAPPQPLRLRRHHRCLGSSCNQRQRQDAAGLRPACLHQPTPCPPPPFRPAQTTKLTRCCRPWAPSSTSTSPTAA